MASLDTFLMRAARLPRMIGGVPSPKHVAAAGELLCEAAALLPQHMDRSTEIAMAAGRLGFADAKPVEHFAEAYQRLLNQKLPEENWSKTQAREVLAAYVAIEGLGHAPRAVSLKMASKASMAAAMLEAPELTAALTRLAATRSQWRDSSNGSAHEAAAIDVTLALQKGLLKKCDALDELSAQDLCNAMVGLARSPMILPEAAAKIVAAARGRCSELQSFRSMLDFSRAIGELMSVLEGPQRQLAADCFAETFPHLISEAQKSFQNHDSIGLCLSGLARIAAALPKESSETASFTREVISPFAETILLICQDEDLQFLEIAAPLLQLENGDAWVKLLRYLAMEGFQKLPDSQESTLRLISIIEWLASVASSQNGNVTTCCPPFFDFAIQELCQRISGLSQVPTAPAAVRRSAKVMSEVYLERPDLLPASAGVLARISILVSVVDLPEVALSLSAMASLYLRVASVGTSKDISKDSDDITLLVRSLEVLSKTAQGLLSPTNSQSDAAFLALSAFAQASRHDGVDARRRVVTSGVQLLDAMCQVWTGSQAQALTLQQAHIFVTCLRTFCIGNGAPSPPRSSLQVLEVVVESIAAVDHKDARLCVAVLQEMHADPQCPPVLKSLLGAQGVHGEPALQARERLRASMAEGVAAQPAQGGFLRRIFGL